MRRATSWITVAAMSLALLTGTLLFSAGYANAATCTPYPAGCTAPANPTDPMSMVTHLPQSPAAVPTTSSSSLPFTGADVAGTVVVGLILIGAGVVLVGTTRRRHAI
jgi:hypothetical protein